MNKNSFNLNKNLYVVDNEMNIFNLMNKNNPKTKKK